MGKKQGLHGFKAFISIVVSGLIAGLLVVWVISSSIKMFVSSISNGMGSVSEGSSSVTPTRGPITYLEAGSFDLCRDLEDMQSFNSVYQARLDDGENFLDTAIENPSSEVREISNKCSWDIFIGGAVESDVVLSYKSLVGGPSVALEDALKEAEFPVESVLGEGEVEGVPGGSRYIYGKWKEEEVFIFAGVVKNSLFCFSFKNKASQGSSIEDDYLIFVRKLVPEIRETLDRVVPD
ncbi:hypothetical protein JCM3263A_05470 [Thermobifida fusca]|uniref:hypothetical protein n=1 Tax=Thermobifida fusca TaxID=2021 RepID=UPI0012DC790C|nr:hypothetical protein [Thermobifida fusca]